MCDLDDMERAMFEEAIDSLPDDIMRAKYGGKPPPKAGKRRSRKSDTVHDITIDLHGFTRVEAIAHLRKTLKTAKGTGKRLLVITGRGNRSSANRPVIREAVIKYLEKAGSLYVRGFNFATPEHGGDGAIDIRVR
jgi:DNA-nicking Smr family endonuclease